MLNPCETCKDLRRAFVLDVRSPDRNASSMSSLVFIKHMLLHAIVDRTEGLLCLPLNILCGVIYSVYT